MMLCFRQISRAFSFAAPSCGTAMIRSSVKRFFFTSPPRRSGESEDSQPTGWPRSRGGCQMQRTALVAIGDEQTHPRDSGHRLKRDVAGDLSVVVYARVPTSVDLRSRQSPLLILLRESPGSPAAGHVHRGRA